MLPSPAARPGRIGVAVSRSIQVKPGPSSCRIIDVAAVSGGVLSREEARGKRYPARGMCPVCVEPCQPDRWRLPARAGVTWQRVDDEWLQT